MPIYRITGPDGQTYRVESPEGASQDEVMAFVQKQAIRPPEPMKMDPTEGMRPIDKFLAGLGKSIMDTSRGVKQLGAEAGNLVGLVSDETVSGLRKQSDEVKARDAALMDTGLGMAGNITGQVAQAFAPGFAIKSLGALTGGAAATGIGQAMIAAPATVGGIVAGASSGAMQGAVQPVGEDDSRTLNAFAGGVGGAIVPTASMGVNVAREVFRPTTQKGRDVIVGRAITRAAGPNANAVKQRLATASQMVPGAMPTVADVAESGGVAALQRAASAVDPETYAAREVQKLDAWRAALADIAGDNSRMASAKAARETSAASLYSRADMGMAPVDPFFQSLMKRPAVKNAITEAQRTAKNNGLDDIFFRDSSGAPIGLLGQGGHFIKKALDDASDAAVRSGKKEASRGVESTRQEFMGWLENYIPEYGIARQEFARLSQPINQMEVGKSLYDALTPASVQFGRLGGMKAEQFSSAVANAPKTIKTASGMNAESLSDVMTPGQVDTITNVAKDVSRTLNAQGLGRGVGSNTAQNLGMANLLESSGVPLGLLNAPVVGPVMGAMGKIAPSENEIRGLLAEAMLDPKKAKALMEAAEAANKTTPTMIGRGLNYTLRPLTQGLLASQLAQ